MHFDEVQIDYISVHMPVGNSKYIKYEILYIY